MSNLPDTALVVGDSMLDRRVEGKASRVSPEGPLLVIQQEFVDETPGGAANLARNIVSLGGHAAVLGIGDPDCYATQTVTRLMGKLGVFTAFVPSGSRMPTKTRITSNGQMLIRSDDEEKSHDVRTPADEIIRRLDALLVEGSHIKIVVVADYDKGVINEQVGDWLMQRCREIQVPIFVDCKAPKLNLYRGASLLKPNMKEAMEMLDTYGEVHPALAGGDPFDMAACAASSLVKHGEFGTVVVTNGRHGCAWYDPADKRVHCYDTPDQDVFDVCGAGDTTMAGLVVGYLDGKGLSFGIRFAMTAAGLAVRKHGMVAVERDDVEEFQYEETGWAAKTMTTPECLAFAERRKKKQQTIVLANGCFDLIHSGHIELFRFAKQQGCNLVVAYNDDESLREYKGTNRPFVPDSYRASHLAQLACVDAVVRFDGDVEKLVRWLKPDVLVKGKDAEPHHVPGADYVASYGGRVTFAPIMFGAASSGSLDHGAKGGSQVPAGDVDAEEG